MDYVRANSLNLLGENRGSFSARRKIELEGDKYHLGDVLIEQEAFGLGYFEPHIDTVAARIAEVAVFEKYNGKLTEELRTQGLITDAQTAIITSGHNDMNRFGVRPFANVTEINVVANEMVGEPRFGQNNSTHPITLYLFRQKEEETMPVGVGFFVPPNRIFEFMTYVPVPR